MKLEIGATFYFHRSMDANVESCGERASPPADMPREFGDYELLEEIGRGGQGVVFRAWQRSLSRTVAVKIIGIGQWATDAHLKRLRREAEAAAKLNHPGIVPIYEVGERDGTYYFSMRFVEGDHLDEVVSRGPISARRAAELIAKVARTAHYAHEHGILHRDIKPGNILLDANGEPHLTDFGLARLVEHGSTVTGSMEVMGTPSYMAPEQAVGNNTAVGSATDVYGLGAVLYELLTGHPPFEGGTTYETIRLLLDSEPRQPRSWNRKVDHDLSAICLKCLEKNPRHRYPSALPLAEDLERWLRHEPIRAKRSGLFTRARKWVERNRTIAALIMLSVVLAAGLGVMIWQRESVRRIPAGIAVLPFENLSDDKEDAFFADGVQDDILTKLAKIADLKVISRTSVMGYRGKRDVRQIGRSLGVSHVLEGTARRSGGKVHVNAQLVDTRTDTGVWADGYDRDLKEAFAIPTQIAQKVAEHLRVKVSTAEKVAIERKPTDDLTAFDLYAQARNLLLTPIFSATGDANLLEAVSLLNQAVAHDPAFFEAYCQLAHAHDLLYFLGNDRTPARLAMADAAVQAASRRFPDAGETHLAHAENLYRGYLDYDDALAELEVAAQTLPNDPRVFELEGYIQRRQGRWEEAIGNLERAADLDPRNVFTLEQLALSYQLLRRYAETESSLDRILTVEPNNLEIKAARAFVELDWKADTQPLHQLIDQVRATNPGATQSIANYWLFCALAERDAAGAKDAVIASGENPITLANENIIFSRQFVEGLIARMTNDGAKAWSAFTAARLEQEKIIGAEPNYGPALCVLGLIDASLGQKEQALREGRRAVELLPVKKDAVGGAEIIKYLAAIAARVEDKNLACEQLAIVAARPSPISYGQLKLLPFWDPLRGDPRFEKIVASLAPNNFTTDHRITRTFWSAALLRGFSTATAHETCEPPRINPIGTFTFPSLILARPFLLDRRLPPDNNRVSLSTIGGDTQNGAVAFTTTHWSVVLAAQGESPAAQEALEKLCRIYWWPLYGFVRRNGYKPEEAQDLTQGFFALLLERRDLDAVRREKGRLRSYLLTSLKNFLGKARRRELTMKRGEGRPLVPLEELLERERADLEPANSLSADRIYERRWALTLLEQVLARLGEEYRVAGNARLFERLKQKLTEESDRPSQAEIAQELGLSENAVKQAFHRLRQRYRLLLREEIAHTVALPGDVEGELRHFIAVLQA